MPHAASKTPYKKSNQVFHRVEIEGFHFTGLASGDPHIVSGRGWVQIGHMLSIEQTKKGWAVCKYSGNEPRILLPELSEQGRQRLSREFGVPIDYDQGVNFATSPAFESLLAWAKAHPRMAARVSRNYDTGPWRELVGIKPD